MPRPKDIKNPDDYKNYTKEKEKDDIVAYAIYSLNPAPWGDAYRLVEMFEREEDAKQVLELLEKHNTSFKKYRIIEWRN